MFLSEVASSPSVSVPASDGQTPDDLIPASDGQTSDDLLDVSDIMPELSYKCLVPKCQKIVQVPI